MSYLKTKRVQLGDNVTASNNFVLRQPDTADGTMRISNGIVGAETDLVTVTSAGNVGVGTSSIDYTAAGRTVVHVEGSAGALLAMEDTGAKSYFFQSGSDLLLENDTASGSMIFGTNNSTERMRIDSAGRVTMPYQPGFSLHYNNYNNENGSQFLTNWWIGSNPGAFNNGNHFNGTTGTFVCPIAGVYYFHFCGHTYLSNTNWYAITFNGGNAIASYTNRGATWNNFSIGGYLSCQANDQIKIWQNANSGPTLDTNYWGSFSGYLVG